MTKLRIVGAAVLWLVLVSAAVAHDKHPSKAVNDGRYASNPHLYDYDRDLPIEDALNFGYSQGYHEYPSGRGGLYGDGIYPGNVISNHHQ